MSTLKILLLSFGMIGIAILSVQNAALVSLSFFGWKSIQIPVGLLLTFFAALGLLLSIFLMPKTRK